MPSIKRMFFVVLISIMIVTTGFSSETKGTVNIMKETKETSQSDVYTEKYRPQYHFSTPQGRLADPNGLVYFDGEYHLFHQKMGTWAHAVSRDLLHWEHLPIALEHDELGQALSGSAIVDSNDTSGLFDGEAGMIAFYTNTTGGEAQSIAYSKDKGRTWERYEGNPVIENPNIKDFRDPKVFWHEESKKWVMVVSTDKSVTFYNSEDLIDWEYQSRFGDGEGSHVAVWETPDLFRLPIDGDENNEKWVLHVGIGDNDVTDGSTSQYFIGEFDGTEFVNSNSAETILYTDVGQDFYAAQSFSNIPEQDGRRIWLGWMVNWRYPYQSPTEPWMGAMSIPRELTLRTTADGSVRLFQEPISEIENIRAINHSVDPFTLEGDHRISGFSGTTYEFEAVVEWSDIEEFGIRLRQSEDEETIIGVNLDLEKVFLDRKESGLETLIDRNGEQFSFGKRFEENFVKENKQIKIRGLVDESSVEVFIDDGEIVFTNLIYTKPTNSGIELYSKGGSADIVSLDFYHLHSTWRDQPAKDEVEGVVVSEDGIELEIGESVSIIANAKPDWLPVTKPFLWEIAEQGIIDIDTINDNSITITGDELGLTTVTVFDPSGSKSKDIIVRVSKDKDSEYTNGWGPSPVTGVFSGKWDIIDESNISSRVIHNPDWVEIYREEVLKGDFSVSADIEWVNQGDEGFPKYGINITDGEGTVVSAFFNNDIHKLETFARYKNEDLNWEGIELPTDTDLKESQTLKVEKLGDTFSFYYNDEKMYERIVQMDSDISVGIINENTTAKFTKFTIEKVIEDDEDNEFEGDHPGVDDESKVDDDSGKDHGQGDNNDLKKEEEKGTIMDSDSKESNEVKGKTSLEQEKDPEPDNALPSTATNMFNLLLIGFGAIFVGAVLWLIAKNRSQLEY